MDGKAIGQRIRALRKRRGLTMRELAERTGLSEGQISRLENALQGVRSETLFRLARALEVEPYIIFLPAEQNGAPPPMSEQVARAFRSPAFVSVVEHMAAAHQGSPRKFEAMETVVSILLAGDLPPHG